MAKDNLKAQARMANTTSITKITADKTDKKLLQLHTNRVQAKSTCKFGAHDKRFACLGSLNTPGRNVITLREDLPEKGSLRGSGYRAGKNGYF